MTAVVAEAVADREPVEILYWYKYNGGKAYEDEKITLDGTNTHCGPCQMTIDRSKEHTADAILVSNGVFRNWQIVSNTDFIITVAFIL